MSRYSGYQTDCGSFDTRFGYTSSSQNQSGSFGSRSSYGRSYSGSSYTGSSRSSTQTPTLRFNVPESVRTFPSRTNSIRTSLLYNEVQPGYHRLDSLALSRFSDSPTDSRGYEESRSSPSMLGQALSFRHGDYQRPLMNGDMLYRAPSSFRDGSCNNSDYEGPLVNGDMPYQAPSSCGDRVYDGPFQRRDTLNLGFSPSRGEYCRDSRKEAERTFERGFIHGVNCGMLVGEALSESPQFGGNRQCTCPHSFLDVPDRRKIFRGNGRKLFRLPDPSKGSVKR